MRCLQEREKLRKEVPQSGEEDETNVLQQSAKLYIFELTKKNWVERGKGLFKVNSSKENSICRMLMRQEKTMRLMLNSRLWKDLGIEKMNDKTIRFIVPSVENPAQLETCSVRFASAEVASHVLKLLEEKKKLDTSTPKKGE